MYPQLLEPLTTPSSTPSFRNHESRIYPKPTILSFQKSKATQQSMHIFSPAKHTHFSIFEKPVTSNTYAKLLESCKDPNLGKQIHAHSIKTGFHGDAFVETKLLNMYGNCGCPDIAHLLFDNMPQRNLYSWTAVIRAHVDCGLLEEALSFFLKLQFEDIELDFFVFPIVLKACSGIGVVELGRQFHGIVVKYQFDINIFVGNALIDMYGKCGSLREAKKVLDAMSERDHVSWNSMITACAANGLVYEALEFLANMYLSDNLIPNIVSWSAVIGGFSRNGYYVEAIELLSRMLAVGFEPNARTLASVLPACAKIRKLSLGKEFHGYITRHGLVYNPIVVNGLVDVYRRCGDMGSALKIFSKFSLKNAVSYNTMIVGFFENGEISMAKSMFDQMEQVRVKKEVISWNSMISGYVNNGLFDEAIITFQNLLMQEGFEPDSFTLGSILTVCADTASFKQGKEIHSYAISRELQSDPFVGGALIEMYCKCGDLRSAQMAFDEVVVRDTSTWNALLSGYVLCNQFEDTQNLLVKMKNDGFQPNAYTWNSIIAAEVENDHLDSAMQLFSEMQISNLRPDIYTIGIILAACSRLATIERGKQVHAYAIRLCYESDVHIGAALVDMYAKCGSIKLAQLAYSRIVNHNLVSHNSMLTAYAIHGHGGKGITLFRKILGNGFRPDHVTFLSALSSCVHVGSVENAYKFFNSMSYYNVKPTLKHFTCMVDLLSRIGHLTEAYELVNTMPMKPDSVLWSALLGGCVIHGNVDFGEIVAERLIELEPYNTGNYVLLSNLFAYAGRWNDLSRIRQKMKDREMQKNPGCSWIEDRKKIHVFLAFDKSHKRTEDIYATLGSLAFHMRNYI